MERTCGFCGKTFWKPRAFARNRRGLYCSQACKGKAYARAHAVELTCPVCLKKFKTTKSAVELGKKCCSERCRKKWQIGPNTSQWQGGKTFWTTVQSRGRGWRGQSYKVRKRDNFTCRHCGKTEAEAGVPFHAHHIVPYFNFTSSRKANALTNLICLCLSCHRKEEHRVPERQIPLFGKF